MIAKKTRQIPALLAALRRNLRRHDLSIRVLAERLDVGEATVKRWLAGKGLTLDRLEQLCALAGLDLADLAQESRERPDHVSQELTFAQERALSDDQLMAFTFIVILGGDDWREIAGDFRLPEQIIEDALDRLDKLALIDRFPSGRVRPRIDRNIIWRKTPMRAQFETQMKAQFLDMDFSKPEAVYASDILKLSDQGAAMLSELIEQHRREIHSLADDDRRKSKLPRKWYGFLSAARALDMSGLTQLSAADDNT
jgi:transcriptional regulator with XRE-family HTH domain